MKPFLGEGQYVDIIFLGWAVDDLLKMGPLTHSTGESPDLISATTQKQ